MNIIFSIPEAFYLSKASNKMMFGDNECWEVKYAFENEFNCQMVLTREHLNKKIKKLEDSGKSKPEAYSEAIKPIPGEFLLFLKYLLLKNECLHVYTENEEVKGLYVEVDYLKSLDFENEISNLIDLFEFTLISKEQLLGVVYGDDIYFDKGTEHEFVIKYEFPDFISLKNQVQEKVNIYRQEWISVQAAFYELWGEEPFNLYKIYTIFIKQLLKTKIMYSINGELSFYTPFIPYNGGIYINHKWFSDNKNKLQFGYFHQRTFENPIFKNEYVSKIVGDGITKEELMNTFDAYWRFGPKTKYKGLDEETYKEFLGAIASSDEVELFKKIIEGECILYVKEADLDKIYQLKLENVDETDHVVEIESIYDTRTLPAIFIANKTYARQPLGTLVELDENGKMRRVKK